MSNAPSQVVVLSDIHIGDTMPTTWYQPFLLYTSRCV